MAQRNDSRTESLANASPVMVVIVLVLIMCVGIYFFACPAAMNMLARMGFGSRHATAHQKARVSFSRLMQGETTGLQAKKVTTELGIKDGMRYDLRVLTWYPPDFSESAFSYELRQTPVQDPPNPAKPPQAIDITARLYMLLQQRPEIDTPEEVEIMVRHEWKLPLASEETPPIAAPEQVEEVAPEAEPTPTPAP